MHRKSLVFLMTLMLVFSMIAGPAPARVQAQDGSRFELLEFADCQNALTLTLDISDASGEDVLIIGWAFADEFLGVGANGLFLDPSTVDGDIVLQHVNLPAGSSTAFFAVLLTSDFAEILSDLDLEGFDLENGEIDPMLLLGLLALTEEIPFAAETVTVGDCLSDAEPTRNNIDVESLDINLDNFDISQLLDFAEMFGIFDALEEMQ